MSNVCRGGAAYTVRILLLLMVVLDFIAMMASVRSTGGFDTTQYGWYVPLSPSGVNLTPISLHPLYIAPELCLDYLSIA